MTPAERALLLAMARDMLAATKSPYSNRCRDLNKAIAAVEAEAEPKSCETCFHWDGVPSGNCCAPEVCNWQPRRKGD